MSDQDEPTQAEKDLRRISNLVLELLDSFEEPDAFTTLDGLLTQAWNASPRMLTTKQPQASDGGHTGKPGSRAPVRLDLWAHAQSCWDMARVEADELGKFVNSQDSEIALRALPALLEATIDVDCRNCDRCTYGGQSRCTCRHRTVTRTVATHHSTLRTALGWQEPRIDWRDVPCPECKRVGRVSVRKEQERVWCRYDDCDFERTGTLSILAVAS